MSQPRALILRTAGTNCDVESAYACEQAGFQTDRVHINRLAAGEVILDDYAFLFVPGGFSYGDDVAAGKVMALELNKRLGDRLRRFEDQGRLIQCTSFCTDAGVTCKVLCQPKARSAPITLNRVAASTPLLKLTPKNWITRKKGRRKRRP